MSTVVIAEEIHVPLHTHYNSFIAKTCINTMVLNTQIIIFPSVILRDSFEVIQSFSAKIDC